MSVAQRILDQEQAERDRQIIDDYERIFIDEWKHEEEYRLSLADSLQFARGVMWGMLITALGATIIWTLFAAL